MGFTYANVLSHSIVDVNSFSADASHLTEPEKTMKNIWNTPKPSTLAPVKSGGYLGHVADQAVSEFHERLRFEISKAVCDVPQTRGEFAKLYDSYSPEQRRELAFILYMEIEQLITIVRDAK